MEGWQRAAMQRRYDRERPFLPPWMRGAVDARASELGLTVVTSECGLATGIGGQTCARPVGHWEAHHWEGDYGGSTGWLDAEQIRRDRESATAL